MGRMHTWQAVVLKTYDIGEADRYCVLCTRERGRMAVRASGVRKPSSIFAGLLGSGQHLEVQVRESGAGFMLSGATLLTPVPVLELTSFAELVQGLEAVLRLTADDDPLPEVFDALVQFCKQADQAKKYTALFFLLHLLQLLGLLPETVEHLTSAETAILQSITTGKAIYAPEHCDLSGLERCVAHHIQLHANSALRSTEISLQLH
jgi:recombinational DNA repair protein (RecF pathway)